MSWFSWECQTIIIIITSTSSGLNLEPEYAYLAFLHRQSFELDKHSIPTNTETFLVNEDIWFRRDRKINALSAFRTGNFVEIRSSMHIRQNSVFA